MNRSLVSRVIRLVTLSSALFGTSSRLVISALHGGGISTYGYFTIQSNLMVCVFLGIEVIAWMRGREEDSRAGTLRHDVHGAIVLYITITALVYNLLLAASIDHSGFGGLILIVNHTITPLLFVADWVMNQRRLPYRFSLIGLWLLYPIAYGVFGSIEGALTGTFRYFFLDFVSTSAGRYVVGLAVVTTMFLIASLAIVGANRLVVRKLVNR